MKGRIRRKSETGGRVAEFSIANPSSEPSHQEVVALLRVLVAHVDELGIQQRAGLNDYHAAVTRRNQIRLRVEYSLLAPLAKVGKLAAKEVPGQLQKFRVSPPQSNNKSFLINARGMLNSAVAAKDLLVSKGLNVNLVDDLDRELNAFDAEAEIINRSRRAHIAARVEMDDVAVKIADLINVLDGFNRYRFQNDPELLAAWNAAKNVVTPAPRKRSSIPPAPPTAPDGSTKVA